MKLRPVLHLCAALAWLAVVLAAARPAAAAELTVRLTCSQPVKLVGALARWDEEGNHRQPVDPRARIEAPAVAAAAAEEGRGRYVFRDLPSGRYDLVIIMAGQVRLEGFTWVPVLEFDDFLAADTVPSEETRQQVAKLLRAARHYENKVTPLYFAGDDKQVRVLMQLLRDKPTSFDAEFGAPAATLRHEVWQFTNRYGGWVKEKRTKVLDRILMARDALRRWTWVWDARLGGIEVGETAQTVSYEVPDEFDGETLRGLLPY